MHSTPGLRAAAAFAATIALVAPGASHAAVTAFSSLQVRNFQAAIYAVDAFDEPLFRIQSDTMIEPFGGPGAGSSDFFNGDASLVCAGICDGIGENDFSRASAGAPANAREFVRSDAKINSSIAVPFGETLGPLLGGQYYNSTVAELNLLDPVVAASGLGHGGFLGTFEVLLPSTAASFEFDVIGSLLASSDSTGGAATASNTFWLQLRDEDGVIAEFSPDVLTRSVTVNGVGVNGYTFNQHVSLPFSATFQPNRRYTLEGSQYSAVGGSLDVPPPTVPEPASWTLMLLGFGGLGAMLRRRRDPSAVPGA